MYRINKSMHDRLTRGELPNIYIEINTHMGLRSYCRKESSTTTASSGAGVIEKAARVLDFGNFERSIQSRKSDVLASYEKKQQQHISIQLDNADRYFSRLIPKEPFIGREIRAFVGFEDELQANHLRIFTGIISEISLLAIMTIEADER